VEKCGKSWAVTSHVAFFFSNSENFLGAKQFRAANPSGIPGHPVQQNAAIRTLLGKGAPLWPRAGPPWSSDLPWDELQGYLHISIETTRPVNSSGNSGLGMSWVHL